MDSDAPRTGGSETRAEQHRRRLTGPLPPDLQRRLKEREAELAAAEADPAKELLGPGALVMFGLAGVLAVFPLGFTYSTPQWWAVIPPSIGMLFLLAGLVWALMLRRSGRLNLPVGPWYAFVGLLTAFVAFAAITAVRMWVQSRY